MRKALFCFLFVLIIISSSLIYSTKNYVCSNTPVAASAPEGRDESTISSAFHEQKSSRKNRHKPI
jgi:hypothetical protein